MKGVVGPVNGQDAEVATVAGSCTPPKAAKAEAVRGGCDFICETNPIFLRDRAVLVLELAGGQCRERFARVGEDRGRAR